jgi:hypothetical protein
LELALTVWLRGRRGAGQRAGRQHVVRLCERARR